jgi:putative glycosyltransferase
MDLSIVSSLYYSAPYIELFYRRTTATAKKIGKDYEIIFVNDGSPDHSRELAIELTKNDPHVQLIDLSRNFGHHKAIMTGLMHARGDLVFQIDVDLEEEPEMLEAFHQELIKTQADVVYGVQDKRKGSLFEKVFGGLFYKCFNFLSNINMPPNLLIARLMTRRYVDALLQHKEYELDLGGLWSITGFNQMPLTVRKHSKGKTTYSPRKRFALAVRSITAFSNKPLILIAAIGSGILFLAFLYFVYILWVYFWVGQPPDGFTTLVLSVWFLGGLMMFSLGVVAIYISIIFSETKRRPYTIVRQIYRSEDHGSSS